MNPDSPYDFQYKGIEWLQNSKPNISNPKFIAPAYYGLIADEMGLGKTVTALETIQSLIESGKRILFVVPGNAVIQWQRQFDKWVLECEPNDFCTTSLFAIKTSKGFIPTNASCVISHNLLAKHDVIQKLIDLNFDGIIIDEIHKFGGSGTKRIKYLKTLLNVSAHKLSDCRIALSGTPIRNYAREMINIGYFLGFPPAMREEVFRTEYLTFDGKALSNPHKFHRDFGSYYLRRTADEVQKDMPAIRRTEIFSEITDPLLAKLYNKELDILDNLMNNGEKLEVFSLLGYLVKLRHITGLAKSAEPSIMEPIYDYIIGEDSDSGPRKATIGIHHRLVARRITNYLGDCMCGCSRMSHFHLDEKTYDDVPNVDGCTKCGCAHYQSKIHIFIIRGGMSVEQKEREKQAFIDCKAPAVCLLSTKAAGEAIDGLQYAAARMDVLEMQWNMAEIRQLEKRIHRTGQTKNCQINYSICVGTIDEFFWEMSKMKEGIATSVEDINYEHSPKFLRTLAETCVANRIKVQRDMETLDEILKPKQSISDNILVSEEIAF